MIWFFAAACLVTLGTSAAFAAEPDNLTLPRGFHAQIVADGVASIRHMAINKDGVIYASTRGGRGGANPGIITLKLDADHKAISTTDHFGTVTGGTGIKFYNGALYAASTTDVYRFTFKPGEVAPSATPDVIITGMPGTAFNNRMLAFDGKGGLYVSIGGTGNICTANAARGARPVGLHPCPGVTDRGGVWKFSATKLNQKFPADGKMIATGLRDTDSMDYRQGDAAYLFMHDRAGTHDTWPNLVSEQDEDNLAEEMHRMVPGTNMGWPYTYYDGTRKARLMAPEYGGDGKVSPPSGIYTTPVLTFHPSHSAPLDMVFYYGAQFPKSYRGGAFIARHGGQGADTPQGHNGYDVVFVPFTANGKPGTPVPFAEGFAGPSPANKSPAKAIYRPVGAAVGPDGSLYIAESQKGRIWRIYYDGK